MKESTPLYTDMLEASQIAFDAKLFTVSYHALAAAMHYAVSLKDALKLREVENIALRHYDELCLNFAQEAKAMEIELYKSLLQMAKTYRLLSSRAR